MSAPTREPCLAEQWFVKDGLEILSRLPIEVRSRASEDLRSRASEDLRFFAADDAEALSQIYRMSREIRVRRVLAGEFHAARQTTDWAAAEVMATITAMISMAARSFSHLGVDA